MKISIACDHGALELKNGLIQYLTSLGHEVKDYGTYTLDSCDYPDYAYPAAKAVANKEVDRAIVVCTTGIGVSIVANKVRGVRCALVTNTEVARLTREHNDTNCLAMGAKLVSLEEAKAICDIWLNTEFTGGRHLRRVEKINKVEEKENE